MGKYRYEMGIPWYTNMVNIKYTVKDKFSNKTIDFEDSNISLQSITDRSFATSTKDSFRISGTSENNDDPMSFHIGYANQLIIKRNKSINNVDYVFPIKLYKECYPDELIDRMDDERNNVLNLHTFAYSYISLKHRYKKDDESEGNYQYSAKENLLFGIYTDDVDDTMTDVHGHDNHKTADITENYRFSFSGGKPINSVGIKTVELSEETPNLKSYENVFITPKIYGTGSTYFHYKELLSAYYYRFINNVETYTFSGPSTEEITTIPIVYGYSYSSIDVYPFKYIFEQRNEWNNDSEAYTYIYNFVPSAFESYMPSVILNSWSIGNDIPDFDEYSHDFVIDGNTQSHGKNMSSGHGYVTINLPNEQVFTSSYVISLSFAVGSNISTPSYIKYYCNLETYYNPILEVSKLDFSYSNNSYKFNTVSNLTYDYKYFNVANVLGDSYTSTLFAAIKYDPNKLDNDIKLNVDGNTGGIEVDDAILFKTKYKVTSDKNNVIRYALIDRNNVYDQTWNSFENNGGSTLSFNNNAEYLIFGSYLYDDSIKEKSRESYSYINLYIHEDNVMTYVTDGNTYIYVPEINEATVYAFSSNVHKLVAFDKYNHFDPVFSYQLNEEPSIVDYNVLGNRGKTDIDKYIIGSSFNIFNDGNDYYTNVLNNPSTTGIDLDYGTTTDISNKVWQYVTSRISFNGTQADDKKIIFLNKQYDGENYVLSQVKNLFTNNTLAQLASKTTLSNNKYELTPSIINNTTLSTLRNQYIDSLITVPQGGNNSYDYAFEQYEVNEDLVNKYYGMYLELDNYIQEKYKDNQPANIGTKLQTDITNYPDGGRQIFCASKNNTNDEIGKYWRTYIKPYELIKLQVKDENENEVLSEDLVGNGEYINYTKKDYDLYKLNEEVTPAREEKYNWANDGIQVSNNSLASYIYSITQKGNYKTAKEILYDKQFILGGTYSYLYSYLSKTYKEGDIYKVTYVNAIGSTTINSLINRDIAIALYEGNSIINKDEWLALHDQPVCIDDVNPYKTDEDGVSLSINNHQLDIVDIIKSNLSFYDNYVYNTYLAFENTFNARRKLRTFTDYVTYYRENVDETDSPLYSYKENNVVITNENVKNYYKYNAFKTTYDDLYEKELDINLNSDYEADIKTYYETIPLFKQLFDNLKYTQYTYQYKLSLDGTIVTANGTANVTINYTYKETTTIIKDAGDSGYYKYRSNPEIYRAWTRTVTGTEQYIWKDEYNRTLTNEETEGYNYERIVDSGIANTGGEEVEFTKGKLDVVEGKWEIKVIDTKNNYERLITLLKGYSTKLNEKKTTNIYYSYNDNGVSESEYAGISQIIGNISDKIDYVSFGKEIYTAEIKPYAYISIDDNCLSYFNEIILKNPNAFNSNFYSITGEDNIKEAESLLSDYENGHAPDGVDTIAPLNINNDFKNYVLGELWAARNIFKKIFDRIANYNDKLYSLSDSVGISIKEKIETLSNRESMVTDDYIHSFKFLDIVDTTNISMIESLETAKLFLTIFKEETIKEQIRKHFKRAMKYLVWVGEGNGQESLKQSLRNYYETIYSKDKITEELKAFQNAVLDVIVNIGNHVYGDIDNENKVLYNLVFNGNNDTSFNYSFMYQILNKLDKKYSLICNYYNGFNIYYIGDENKNFINLYDSIYSLEDVFSISDDSNEFINMKSCFRFKYFISNGEINIDEKYNLYGTLTETNSIKDFNGTIKIDYGTLENSNFDDPRLHVLLYFCNSFVREIKLKDNILHSPHMINLPTYRINRISNDISITFDEPVIEVGDLSYRYDLKIEARILNPDGEDILVDTINTTPDNIYAKTFIIRGNFDENGNIINSFYLIKYQVCISEPYVENGYVNYSKENVIVYYFSNDDGYKYERINFGNSVEAQDILAKYDKNKIISMHLYIETNSNSLEDPMYWIYTSGKNNTSTFKLIEEVYYE